jgi:hypothetical protein
VLRETLLASKPDASVLLKRANSSFNRILNYRLSSSIDAAPPPAAELENFRDGAVLFVTKSPTAKLKFHASSFQRSQITLCDGFL